MIDIKESDVIVIDASLQSLGFVEAEVILITEAATFLDVSVDKLIFTDALDIIWTDGLEAIFQ